MDSDQGQPVVESVQARLVQEVQEARWDQLVEPRWGQRVLLFRHQKRQEPMHRYS